MKLSDKFYMAAKTKCEMTKHVSAPYFRYAFSAAKNVVAELSVCGLGFYELYINGTKITRGHLSAYISIPDHLCYYDRYDITPYLIDGKNVIGLILGNGMQNPIGARVWGFEKGDFVVLPNLRFCARLKVQTVQRRPSMVLCLKLILHQ